jgi:hypothetical protein
VGRNGPSYNALSAFMLTVAVWESYLNLVFFSPFTRLYFGDAIFNKMNDLMPGLKNMNIIEKSIALPLIAFDKTFMKSARPFQDLKDIVTIRNAVTHNVMHTSPVKAVAAIRTRGLLLPSQHCSMPQSWSEEISTLETMRWCINTIANLDRELFVLPTNTHISWRTTFGEISDEKADAAIRKRFET